MASRSTSTDAGPSPVYFCNMFCGKPFLNNRDFEEHQNSHKSRKSVMSELKKHFPVGTTFRSAVPAPVSPRPPAVPAKSPGAGGRTRNVFPCSVCDKVFKTEHYQIRHVRIHTGEKPFACSTCGRAFSQECSLKRHERIHLGDARERSFACELCPKAFEYRFNLAHHMRTIHKKERLYRCGDCDKVFHTSSNLTTHRRVHTGHRPYVCGICNKGFTQSNRLKSHQVIHGPGRHVCETCGKSFSQQARLDKHRKVHAMEKPFACDICEEVFTDKRARNSHRNTHVKPFLCEDCGKAFSQKTGLTKHRVRCHKLEETEGESQDSNQTADAD